MATMMAEAAIMLGDLIMDPFPFDVNPGDEESTMFYFLYPKRNSKAIFNVPPIPFINFI